MVFPKIIAPAARSLATTVASWENDCNFSELLASHNVFVFPGTPQEIPGYFRISLTANEDMISRSLPKFRTAIEYAQSHESFNQVV